MKHNKPPARAEDAVPLRTDAEWEAVIRRDLDHTLEGIHRTVAGIISSGTHLGQAKPQLGHGNFEPMCERLGLSTRTAQRLMAIAQDERLATHISLLPPSWGTLYLLTRLDNPTFNRLIEDGTITPTMERGAVEQLKRGRRTAPTPVPLPIPDTVSLLPSGNGKPSPEAMEARQKENAEAEAEVLQKEEKEEAADEIIRDSDLPVAGSDLGEIEVRHEAIEKLIAEKRALEAKIEDQAATISALQSAESKWRDNVDAHRTIINQRDSEIAPAGQSCAERSAAERAADAGADVQSRGR